MALLAASFLFVVGALVVAFRGPLPAHVTLGAALGMGCGGALFGLPGAVMLVGATVTAATGPGPHAPWGLIAAILVGGMLGGMAGAATLVAYLAKHRRGLFRGAIASVVCGAVGCAAAWAAIAMSSTADNGPLWLFAPFVILAASLAGFTRALPAQRSA